MKPCSKLTSVKNTICYPEAKHETYCPILDIQMIPNDTFSENDFPKYSLLNYGDYVLAYTKEFKDQLPITATRVGSQ